ncbi:MAG: CapA family protein, partial [Anaerolineales bacterium]|nr:CapA family protein [Anaerolineales bacterium]
RDVTAVAPQVDHVIVVLHSGYEYVDSPSPPQVAAAHAAIDAGAALVIGHHAHILQGIEYYNGGVIVYGLGNFAFEIDGPPETAILNVWLDQNGVRQLELLPAVIQFGGQPRPAETWEAPAILQRVYALTNALNAP